MTTKKLYTIRQKGTSPFNGQPFDRTLSPSENRPFMEHLYEYALRNSDVHEIQFIERTIREWDIILRQEFK